MKCDCGSEYRVTHSLRGDKVHTNRIKCPECKHMATTVTVKWANNEQGHHAVYRMVSQSLETKTTEDQ